MLEVTVRSALLAVPGRSDSLQVSLRVCTKDFLSVRMCVSACLQLLTRAILRDYARNKFE